MYRIPLSAFFNPNNNLPSTAIHSSQFTALSGSNIPSLPVIIQYFCSHFSASINSLFHISISQYGVNIGLLTARAQYKLYFFANLSNTIAACRLGKLSSGEILFQLHFIIPALYSDSIDCLYSVFRGISINIFVYQNMFLKNGNGSKVFFNTLCN
ncbi:MAG: hypothetical protein WCG25_06275 [bacterium]